MAAKRSIVEKNAPRYRRASKKQKTQMLNELTQIFSFHRKYLIHLLNQTGKVYHTAKGEKLIGDPTVTHLHRRGRKKIYTEALIPYLEIIWELTNFRASIYLVYFIRNNPQLLEEKPLLPPGVTTAIPSPAGSNCGSCGIGPGSGLSTRCLMWRVGGGPWCGLILARSIKRNIGLSWVWVNHSRSRDFGNI